MIRAVALASIKKNGRRFHLVRLGAGVVLYLARLDFVLTHDAKRGWLK